MEECFWKCNNYLCVVEAVNHKKAIKLQYVVVVFDRHVLGPTYTWRMAEWSFGRLRCIETKAVGSIHANLILIKIGSSDPTRSPLCYFTLQISRYFNAGFRLQAVNEIIDLASQLLTVIT